MVDKELEVCVGEVRNHYGTTWWNREPLVWVWTWALISCAAVIVAVIFPNMLLFVRWPGTHPNVFLLGVACPSPKLRPSPSD